MIADTASKGRNLPDLSSLFLITCTIISGTHSETKPVRGISLLVIAAFLCGCQMNINPVSALAEHEKHVQLSLDLRSYSDEIHYAHILTFNADSLGWLDSYQHIDEIENREITIASTSGSKNSFIYVNVKLEEDELGKINTAEDLGNVLCHLENVQMGMLPMLGSAMHDQNSSSDREVVMKRLISEVTLNSISCDFSGTAYEGESITNARVYLTNVNAESSLSGESRSIRRLINSGRLCQEDIEKFSDPKIIMRDLGADIGKEKMKAAISLYCFNNDSSEEGPGSPFTRLVIEGKIQGVTYYWPLAINRGEGGSGIVSNCRYAYDLTIKRKGSLDPETEVSVEDCETAAFAFYPESYIRGDIGDTLHLWCEVSPADVPFDIGLEELEEDKENGIYDYIIDEDGHGVRLILKGPGVGLVYMEAGAPINEAALWIIEVNLPGDTSQYTTSRMISTAQECRQRQDVRLRLQPLDQGQSPNPQLGSHQDCAPPQQSNGP